MLHAITVRPVRQRAYSAELGVELVRVVGFRAFCSCGWRGAVQPEHRLAAWEGRWHSGAEVE